jgi:hypothetical protein
MSRRWLLHRRCPIWAATSSLAFPAASSTSLVPRDCAAGFRCRRGRPAYQPDRRAGRRGRHQESTAAYRVTLSTQRAAIEALAYDLLRQLDRTDYVIRSDSGRLRISNGSHYVPDLFVLPRALERRLRRTPGSFEVYDLD